jgi:hypothetical protein
MFIEAMKVVLIFIMKNHVYNFNGDIKKQMKGGPIGLELTGVLAQIFMIWWDRRLVKDISESGLNIHMYKRYVDDINIVMEAPDMGARYVNGSVVITEYTKDEDRERENDERCMKFVRSVANCIHPSIQVEVDYCSNYQDRKLPILDLKVWIEKRTVEGVETQYILHEFYAKSVASKFVVHARSALPWNVKRTVLTQEVLRVLLNCSYLLPWEDTVQHVEEIVLRMQYSGYNKKFRHEVVNSALKAYKQMVATERAGGRPLYRNKEWKRIERTKEKERKGRTWYKRGGYTSVIMIPTTPNSELKRKLECDIKRSGLKIKIVEKASTSVKSLLQKSNPLKREKCNDKDCLVCTTGGKGNCKSTGITYEVSCKRCGDKYIGETARNAYTRGKEHLMALDSKAESSIMNKHCKDKHGGIIEDFTMNVIGTFQGDAMLRQISESVRISRENQKALINNKTEWNFVKLPRMNVV